LAAEMRGYIAEGFTGVKMKIGGVSLEEDAERVVAVREAIGPDARLMVDALHAYDLPQAMQMADKIHSFDIYWFESPVALEDVAGHGEVNRHSGIPVCGNESLTGLPAFRHLLEHQGATFVHFDLSVCGGISEGMKIAKLAAEAGLTCTLHAASGVQLFSASVNLACSVPNCDSVEYHQVHQWLSDYHPKVMEHEGPQVKPVDGSGLGNTFLTPQFIEEIFRQETVRTSKN
ncbi:MAG: mandelate racemase/muconate lactonizing enzyme family protein, partial [Verrucomicrobiae bacterium]|nr:mandelate racemase/muconate lactonizing enzyme family protein [Verrucomicrobiae bacterium]